MTKAQPYSEYEESGVEWLGQIPSTWTADRFRYCFQESSEVNGQNIVGEMLSVSGYRGVELKVYDDENQKRDADQLETYRVVHRGQLAVNTMWLNYAGLGVSELEGHMSPAYRAYWFNKDLNPRFVHHLLRSSTYVDGYTALLTGVRPNSLQMSRQNLMDFPILIPSRTEQDAIAAFLDRETAQIDDLIAKQERLIGLLAEKRQAVITQAVTKGLDPNAPTKPSGVPWLGETPTHWTLPRLKNCSRIKRGRFMHRPRNAPHLYDGEYPFIQTGAIARTQGKYVTEFSQTLSEAGLETSAMMPKGTLVMAIAANIGDVAILAFNSCAPDSVLGFEPTRQTNTDFLYYALTAKREELTREAPVTSQGNLNVERVGNVTIPLPPIKEQAAIVETLDDRLAQMSQIASKASAVRGLLQERRSALISAAVTGKIDVREGVA